MGLLLDLSPDGGMDDGRHDDELEAELLSLVGGGGKGGKPQGKKGEGKGEEDGVVFIFIYPPWVTCYKRVLMIL